MSGKHKCIVYCDDTITLPLASLCKVMNARCKRFSFRVGKTKFRLSEEPIANPRTYRKLSPAQLEEIEPFEFAFLCTTTPYANNYFFDYPENIAIISFDQWSSLTPLRLATGLIFFIASIICDEFQIGKSHDTCTGCVNDFWWDKTDIDTGMRAGLVCPKCRNVYDGETAILKDVEALLNFVSSATRRRSKPKQGVNGGRKPKPAAKTASKRRKNLKSHVFLAHNSADKDAIRKINDKMKRAGILTWFDEEQIKYGEIWQLKLQDSISQVRAACIFVGANKFGRWEEHELLSFTSEFVNRNCRVIPVILPDASQSFRLPIFLNNFHAVDLRKNEQERITRLIGQLKT